jgi:hypothetical protein
LDGAWLVTGPFTGAWLVTGPFADGCAAVCARGPARPVAAPADTLEGDEALAAPAAGLATNQPTPAPANGCEIVWPLIVAGVPFGVTTGGVADVTFSTTLFAVTAVFV